ncbi:thioredoxin family protein [Clavibacter tessellarius]|uniref:thioredoxin family protein n=1 Tax=Clavibacter tessellarius TaxID=31965 RepID=UPI003252581D
MPRRPSSSTSGPPGAARARPSPRSSTRSPPRTPASSLVKIDVDDNPEVAMKYKITSIPAMKVFQAGEVVKTVIGAKPKPALEQEFADFLK